MDGQGLVFVADKVKDPDMKDGDQTGDHGHDGVEWQLDKGVDHVVSWYGKNRVFTIPSPGDHRGYGRGNDQGGKG